MTAASRMNDARIARLITEDNLAEWCGMAQSSVHRMLTGTYNISFHFAFTAAPILGLDAIDLLHEQLDEYITTYLALNTPTIGARLDVMA